jgi:molybdenum-dependent DNA-binding transcriptional regulator ModE
MTFEQLKPLVGLRGKGRANIGDGRIGLLEAIDTYGSLSAAARNVDLTYKAIWGAVAGVTIGQ